ncbi:AEC family transporter [Marinobacter sp. R17]|uniref:AEC family transporter n=1 Tax=Marinobacter sp. R17 TaxID=2484250 RepID=UPI000F4B7D81|nr:AEC family transporter [Marinobacter sp. R17]ROU01832.1 AEC family transporter [Marinobacter sp. R17]
MDVLIQALVPVFGLILLGQFLRRIQFPGDGFWPMAERFTYYVLFPPMLLYKLGSAHIPASAYGDVALVVVGMGLSMTLILAVIQWFTRWPGPVFSSVYQGAIRFNTFVGLASAGLLMGDDGLSLFAVAVAINVPMLNLLCILMFSVVVGQGRPKLASVFRTIVTNPLIIGSVSGALWGYLGIGFHPVFARFLEPLSSMGLPLGLLTVGAGLQLKGMRSASMPFLVSTALKLVAFPFIAAGLAWLVGVEGLLLQVVVLLAALPTASSAYILARQLGGDATLMAGIISGQTLLAIFIMPLTLGLLG